MTPSVALHNTVRNTLRSMPSMVLHELRVPLTVCRGHLEVLMRDPARQTDSVPVVLAELERMERLVNDLDTLFGTEDREFLRLASVGLADLTTELAAKAPALGERRWRVVSRGHGLIVCDPERVIQAMLALADNAVRHTHPSSPVHIGSATRADCACLWVTDFGPGVPPTEQERIFDPFARGAEARGRHRGAGLGLAVAGAIARAHGGDIELKSRPGSGATFAVKLPLST